MTIPHKRGYIVWFTGLPCSGKTTLANKLQSYLFENNFLAVVLDGDQIRKKFKRVNVVSILGEGGVGKTALAQEIGHQYYEEEGPFEQILYVSLKTQALDLEGRKQLRDEIP